MKPVKLSDLIPEKAEIELLVNGERRVFILRPKTISDDAWISTHWGNSQAVQKVFEEFDLIKISKLLFRLISPKEPLEGREVDDWDDDGRKIKRFKPGWEVLQDGIEGQSHMLEVINALMRTWGISEPLTLQDDDGKKKRVSQKK
jgi:hypothetical protein